MLYLDIYVSAKVPDLKAPLRILSSGGFIYELTLSVPNNTGGLRVDVYAKIDGNDTKMTDGIYFSVIVCSCDEMPPQRYTTTPSSGLARLCRFGDPGQVPHH
jgi:hypothetical protein